MRRRKNEPCNNDERPKYETFSGAFERIGDPGERRRQAALCGVETKTFPEAKATDAEDYGEGNGKHNSLATSAL